MGRSYLNGLRARAPDAARIIDKMPGNFRLIGMIRQLLPNARIIHTRRDPVDTCLSCFTKLFTAGHLYSYELGELGRYHRAYDDLMAHWRAVLPPGAMIEVHYEDVVADLEGQARRMIAYLDLPWDERCLTFHTTRRHVQTASFAQVRRHIYRDSVERWRRYGDRLAPLLRALEEADPSPFAPPAA